MFRLINLYQTNNDRIMSTFHNVPAVRRTRAVVCVQIKQTEKTQIIQLTPTHRVLSVRKSKMQPVRFLFTWKIKGFSVREHGIKRSDVSQCPWEKTLMPELLVVCSEQGVLSDTAAQQWNKRSVGAAACLINKSIILKLNFSLRETLTCADLRLDPMFVLLTVTVPESLLFMESVRVAVVHTHVKTTRLLLHYMSFFPLNTGEVLRSDPALPGAPELQLTT